MEKGGMREGRGEKVERREKEKQNEMYIVQRETGGVR